MSGSYQLSVEAINRLLLSFRFRVLQQNNGIEEGLGAMQWELVGTLLLAWLVVYLIIWKGLHSSGKVNVKDFCRNRM